MSLGGRWRGCCAGWRPSGHCGAYRHLCRPHCCLGHTGGALDFFDSPILKVGVAAEQVERPPEHNGTDRHLCGPGGGFGHQCWSQSPDLGLAPHTWTGSSPRQHPSAWCVTSLLVKLPSSCGAVPEHVSASLQYVSPGHTVCTLPCNLAATPTACDIVRLSCCQQQQQDVSLRAEWPDAGGIFLPNTPNSLVELGQPEKAKEVLRRVRGTPDVDTEFQSILIANKVMEKMENPWRAIIRRACKISSSSSRNMWAVTRGCS